jgi:hypothetical protein
MAAWLSQLAGLLERSLDAASQKQPLVVFLSLLTSGTIIVLVGMALRFKYKTEKLRSLERQRLLAVLYNLNLSDRDGSRARLLSWLPKRRH